MIYIRAGVYAEGPTDYDFLLPLLDRLLDSLAASLFSGAYEVGSTAGIDAPRVAGGGRAERIAAAVDDWWGACTLFVIHSDGAGDPASARENCVEPGVEAARSKRAELPLLVAACIPVREIEAWMLVDPEAFRTILGEGSEQACPADPEREIDPKATLRRILKEGGVRRPPERLYAFFGERVRLDALRSLPAFQVFEREIVTALRALAGAP
jgi:Domain of unknown function (DUF4276)